MSFAMMDIKRVQFLSSVHTDNTFDKTIRDKKENNGVRIVEKPVMGQAYNDHMNGVDELDQKLGSYSYPHKSAKWYRTIYHRVREVALINGYILYLKSCQKNNQKPMPTISFRENVIDDLLRGWEMNAAKKGRPSIMSITEKPDRLTGRHFAAQFDDAKHRPECVVCSGRTRPGWKRVQTRFYCRDCGKPMCPTTCFRLYHTQKDFVHGAAREIYNLSTLLCSKHISKQSTKHNFTYFGHNKYVIWLHTETNLKNMGHSRSYEDLVLYLFMYVHYIVCIKIMGNPTPVMTI